MTERFIIIDEKSGCHCCPCYRIVDSESVFFYDGFPDEPRYHYVVCGVDDHDDAVRIAHLLNIHGRSS